MASERKFHIGDRVIVLDRSTITGRSGEMPFSTRGLIGQEFTVSEVYGSARYQYLYRFVENPGALGEFFGVPEEFLAIADAVDVEFDSRFDAMII